MEDKELEISEEQQRTKALAQAKEELWKDKRQTKISKISSIVVPILIGVILIGYPILMHNINASKKEKYWKEMIGISEVRYSELKAEESESLRELNKENNGRFYWLKEAEITGTYQFKEDNKIILIEEHYLYEGIECVIYVTNANSTIHDLEIDKDKEDKRYIIETFVYINYGFQNEECYCNFTNEYEYQIKIQSTDTTTIESIFSHLTTSHS